MFVSFKILVVKSLDSWPDKWWLGIWGGLLAGDYHSAWVGLVLWEERGVSGHFVWNRNWKGMFSFHSLSSGHVSSVSSLWSPCGQQLSISLKTSQQRSKTQTSPLKLCRWLHWILTIEGFFSKTELFMFQLLCSSHNCSFDIWLLRRKTLPFMLVFMSW